MLLKRCSLPVLLLAVLAVGCTDGADDAVDGERGPIGKADALGSCEATLCDGLSLAGDCWCDELCSFYGDCCADKVEVCDAPQTDSCGGFTIGPAPSCDEGEYCHYEEGATCGWADAPGVCLDTPQACIEIYAPVCGCDGTTHPNSCYAHMAGTSVLHDGECAPPEPTYCLSDEICGEGSFCDASECNTPPCPPGMACPQVCFGICALGEPPEFCGGFGNLPCAPGKICIDDPGDDCAPETSGADCGGICVDAPAGVSCEGACGGQASDGCWCDDQCSFYGDCCADHEQQCSTDARTVATGTCVKNTFDECTTDADCTSGGCGGELCHNPALGGGITTCECTAPAGPSGCGCVAGQCAWYE